jgi:hypothetical protein
VVTVLFVIVLVSTVATLTVLGIRSGSRSATPRVQTRTAVTKPVSPPAPTLTTLPTLPPSGR